MNKLILILALGLTLISCNKEDIQPNTYDNPYKVMVHPPNTEITGIGIGVTERPGGSKTATKLDIK